jgi:hypothetical protein
MAGTLTISTLSDGTNSTSATNPIMGSAKAWVNFDGLNSPYAIRASYNVSSITRNSTGIYTVNFTNAMVDAKYVVTSSSSYTYGSPGNNAYANGGTVNASSCKVLNQDAGASVYDVAEVTVAIFR